MRHIFRKSMVIVTVAALSLHPVLAQAQVAVGNANKIISNVRGVLNAKTRGLAAKDAVFSQEVVNTGADSAARFVFQDNTILSVGASSSVTLDKFVFDPDANKSTVALSMTKGVMRFVTGNLSKDKYTIRTPTALIGIRGTILVVTVAANGLTTVSVVEGAVSVSAAGTTTTVNSGYSTTVSPGGPPTPPSPSPPAPPQVQGMQTALGPEPGIAAGSQASLGGLGGLSAGAIAGALAVAAALAVAISAAASDSDSVSTTDASSSTSTQTN